ncbi:MAG: hypothetical protein RLZZ524_2298 [Pseudomonadota bacterium]|jgi:hypothetical protein
MANFDLTTTQLGGAIAEGLARWTPNFAATATFDATKTPLAASDTADLLIIPAGTIVLGVGYKILTPEGAADTFDVGDSGSGTRYFSNVSSNQAAGTVGWIVPAVEGTPNVVGYLQAAANKLRINADAALTVAKIQFFVIGFTPPA